MTDQRSPLDASLDLVLFAPVGLALTLSEEVPKLAAKGRAVLGARVATARVVGQFAVAQGRSELRRRVGTDAGSPQPAPGGPSAPPATAAPPTTATPVGTVAPPTTATPVGTVAAGTAAASAPGPARARAASAPVPRPEDLAIPGYDSLSASQVVQRLAGLSGAELHAVKEYESATRGRRTILARVGQLQGH